MGLINAADARRIEEAITRVEQRTAAEIVVAVIPRAAAYGRWRAFAAGAWAIAAAVLLYEFVPALDPLWVILSEFPFGLLAYTLLGWAPLERWLVPREDAERAVDQAARRIFVERGVHRTRDASGVLLLLSELERRVVLLGDTGVNERVGEDGWREHVRHIIDRIHEGRAADGVLEVLAELEQMLAGRLPVAPDDLNELANEVVRTR